MLKSWFISLFVLILLALAYHINLFDWLATGYAMWLGIVLVAIMLLLAFINKTKGLFLVKSPFVLLRI